MALRLCVLASSSAGNCTYISSGQTALLVDAGLSGREISARLGLVGAELSQVAAVCLSHEHEDHTRSIGVLSRRHGIPIFANSGTMETLARDPKLADLNWRIFTTGSPFEVGDMRIEPFSVPHDAMDPVGFVIHAGGVRAAIVTDMGMATTLIRERLRGCGVIIIEANHDERLLEAANRPISLKQRIRGRQGHLSNAKAAATLAEIAGPELKMVLLAHLSGECNRGELALRTTETVLRSAGHHHVKVSLTYPDRISEICAC